MVIIIIIIIIVICSNAAKRQFVHLWFLIEPCTCVKAIKKIKMQILSILKNNTKKKKRNLQKEKHSQLYSSNTDTLICRIYRSILEYTTRVYWRLLEYVYFVSGSR